MEDSHKYKKASSLHEDLQRQCAAVADELKSHEGALYEYLGDNVLDISVTASVSDRSLSITGFSLAVTIGGPNVYVRKDGVYGYWGQEQAYSFIPTSVADEVMTYVLESTEGLSLRND